MQFTFDFEEQKIVEEDKNKKPIKEAQIKKNDQKKSEEIELPVTIFGGPYTFEVLEKPGIKKITNKELKAEVLKRFPELDKCFKLGKMEKGYKLILSFEKSKLNQKEIKSIRLGNQIDFVLPYMMNAKEAAKSFYQEYPEYIGCSFHVVEKYYLMVPFVTSINEKRKYPNPVKIGFDHNSYETLEFDDKSEVSVKEIFNRYAGLHPEYAEGSAYYAESENLIIPLMKEDLKGNSSSLLICTPITVKTGAYDIIFTSDDFGKEKVTLEEIRKGLEKQFSEYSKERTSMEYDENHSVIAILRGSKKGVKIIPRKEGYGFDKRDDGVTIEKQPYGVFQKKESIAFTFTGPKIPIQLLYDIIDIFKTVPDIERSVQLFLKPDGTYFLYEPEQTATRSSIYIVRNHEMEDKYIFVMDIHSHGIHPAFFSDTDNHDEKGTRLYMVIGNLNSNIQSIAIRAGLNGEFCQLAVTDVFSEED